MPAEAKIMSLSCYKSSLDVSRNDSLVKELSKDYSVEDGEVELEHLLKEKSSGDVRRETDALDDASWNMFLVDTSMNATETSCIPPTLNTCTKPFLLTLRAIIDFVMEVQGKKSLKELVGCPEAFLFVEIPLKMRAVKFLHAAYKEDDVTFSQAV
ncbi:hypothetical protein V6N12_062455 [Hibiscus sabdariffa]|uniref:Uncharacterized protein n=1 Tax=Hibiscus sabdariffa TaxID=183260 RepID=A0ABR2F8Y2_9ROSI